MTVFRLGWRSLIRVCGNMDYGFKVKRLVSGYISGMIKQKKCIACNEIMDVTLFHRDKYTKDGYRCYCKKCCVNKYQRSELYFWKQLHNTANVNSAKRLSKGRSSAGSININYMDLIDLHQNQNGLCYYSNIPMSIYQLSDWQCSIERLNNDEGYHLNNIVLCCLEFNSAKQWNLPKISSIPKLITQNVDTSSPK